MSMTHLDADDLIRASGDRSGRALPAPVREHLAGCADCAGEVAAMARLALAARTADSALTGPVSVPDFDTLIAPVLAASKTLSLVPAKWRLGRAARLAASLVAAQARLVPRALPVLTLLGLAAAVLLGVALPDPGWRASAVGAVISALILAGGLATCTPRADPRRELLLVLPISPRIVFLARLVLVLAVDLAAALLASVIATVRGGVGGGPLALVTGWLGPALLAAAVAIVLAVWRSRWLGGLAGGLVWYLGVAANLPNRKVPVGVGALLDRVAGNQLAGLLIALALLAAAVWLTPGGAGKTARGT